MDLKVREYEGLDSSRLPQGPIKGFCKDWNEQLGSVKGGGFSDYQLLKKGSSALI